MMTYDSLIPLCHPGPLDIRLGNSILTWRENLACAEALRNNWLCGCCQFMSFSCQQILCCTREEIYLTRDVQPNMFNCLASGRMAETDVTDSLELRKSKKKIDSRFKRLKLKRFTLLHTYVGENPTTKIFPVKILNCPTDWSQLPRFVKPRCRDETNHR